MIPIQGKRLINVADHIADQLSEPFSGLKKEREKEDDTKEEEREDQQRKLNRNQENRKVIWIMKGKFRTKKAGT